MSDTPRTDREQDVLAAKIKAKTTNETMESGGWARLRDAEIERNYLVRKIERLDSDCARMLETIKFYQGPKEKYCIEAVQHYEARNTELERENAELKELVARMKLALSAQCVNCEWLHENECGDCRTKKLLEAAERGE